LLSDVLRRRLAKLAILHMRTLTDRMWRWQYVTWSGTRHFSVVIILLLFLSTDSLTFSILLRFPISKELRSFVERHLNRTVLDHFPKTFGKAGRTGNDWWTGLGHVCLYQNQMSLLTVVERRTIGSTTACCWDVFNCSVQAHSKLAHGRKVEVVDVKVCITYWNQVLAILSTVII
jgi:hypothetical protein